MEMEMGAGDGGGHYSPDKKPLQTMAAASTTMVSNGSIDIHGRTVDKSTTGGWKAAPFIIVNEVVERMVFFAIAVSMVTYLVREMHQDLPDAVTHVTDWIGAAFFLTILGAFLADAYLGRFMTIIVFSCIYTIGMVLLTLSASINGLRPPPCAGNVCPPASTGQSAFLYAALSLIALGTGGIKPCVAPFGADQFDEADEQEAQKKYSFFNWFFFAINVGVLLGLTLMVYVEVRKGWGWGFGVPTVAVVLSIAALVKGAPYYRYQRPMGSALTRFAQVVVAACRNHAKGCGASEAQLHEVETREPNTVGACKLPHTPQYRFLDKAAVVTDLLDKPGISTSRWRLCTVTQVEEFKSFVRVLPIWATTIALSLSFAQLSTFFVFQATIMDRKLGPNFVVPPGSVTVLAAINGLLIVPLYEGLLIPILRRHTGHQRGITSLQRIGVGLFISVFSLAAAALVEKWRRDRASADPTPVTFFWLLPQYFLLGTAEVFTYVGQMEFFYDEATDGTRSLSSAIFLSELGIGNWLSTALVKIVERTTGGVEAGWLRNDLNHSRLDLFYWILCGVNAVNFCLYVVVSRAYRGREDAVRRGAHIMHDT